MSGPSALPDPVAIAIPAILLVTIVDIVVKARKKKRDYELRDSATSLVLSFVNIGVAAALATTNDRLALRVFEFRLFDIGHAWWAFVLIFFADDLVFYWYHRLMHQHRWWWAAHVTHHDSQHFNITTGVRQPWLNSLSLLWWTAWLPLSLVGFPLDLILFQLGVSKVYQIMIHTESIRKLPRWVEWIFNTPSNHRVHHATNPAYLDRNYGGILMIWDRLFGTYAEENDAIACRYGVMKNVATFNPIRLATYEWLAIGRDVLRAKTWKERWLYVVGAPGWSPDGSSRTAAELRAEWEKTRGTPT